jgi:hypothetical protein
VTTKSPRHTTNPPTDHTLYLAPNQPRPPHNSPTFPRNNPTPHNPRPRTSGNHMQASARHRKEHNKTTITGQPEATKKRKRQTTHDPPLTLHQHLTGRWWKELQSDKPNKRKVLQTRHTEGLRHTLEPLTQVRSPTRQDSANKPTSTQKQQTNQRDNQKKPTNNRPKPQAANHNQQHARQKRQKATTITQTGQHNDPDDPTPRTHKWSTRILNSKQHKNRRIDEIDTKNNELRNRTQQASKQLAHRRKLVVVHSRDLPQPARPPTDSAV